MNLTLSQELITAFGLMGANTEQQINAAISRLLFEKAPFKGEVREADSHGNMYVGRKTKWEMRRIE